MILIDVWIKKTRIRSDRFKVQVQNTRENTRKSEHLIKKTHWLSAPLSGFLSSIFSSN